MTQSVTDPHYDPHADGPMRAPGTRHVRPKDAATLILVRRDLGRPQLLMGRRHGGHNFMPDKWVFPGGRVDRGDFHAPHATDLRPEVLAKLEKTANPSRCRALAMAAVRETFEEAGLLLARPARSRPGAGPWRDFLVHGAAPDLAALDFVARAVTPAYRPKRFDARFFMAGAEHLLSLDRLPDCGELDEIGWFDLDEAVTLDLPGITRFVIKEVALRLEDPHRPAPVVRFANGARRLTHL